MREGDRSGMFRDNFSLGPFNRTPAKCIFGKNHNESKLY